MRMILFVQKDTNMHDMVELHLVQRVLVLVQQGPEETSAEEAILDKDINERLLRLVSCLVTMSTYSISIHMPSCSLVLHTLKAHED